MWARAHGLLPRHSVAPRIAGLFGLLFAAIVAFTVASLEPRLRATRSHLLRERGEAMAAIAADLLAPMLELDALEPAEDAVAALFEDSAMRRIEIRSQGEIWLESAQSEHGPGAATRFTHPLPRFDGEPIGELYLWVSDAQFEAERQKLVHDALHTLGWALAAVLVALVVVVRRVVRPLESVTEAALRIAGGHVERPPSMPRGDDEIGRAGRAFHSMQARLHELADAAGRVADGHLDPPHLGPGPLFESFARMVDALRAARAEEAQQRERLAEAAERAEAANDAKGRFLARISHELRTPLNGVVGMTELCLDHSELPTSSREDLHVVREQAGRMLELVDHLLQFAVVDAGKLELRVETFDMGALIHTETTRHRSRATERGLELGCDAPSLWGQSDPHVVRQVLACLVDNAIKFTEEGEIRIHLNTRIHDGCVRIDVIDTGPGIPEEARTRIFDAFEQADGTTTRSHGGVGVGLAFASGLVHGLGGRLDVDSVVGSGSTFSCTIPFPQLETGPRRTNPSRSKPCPTSHEVRVLVVEDERVNQMVARRHLEAMGAAVTLANNGLQAVEFFQVRDFDIILMDLMMPVMDGYTATRRIRSKESPGQRTPIIAVSANAMPGDREKALLSGVDEYLSKPLRGPVLKEAIHRWTR